MILTCKVASTCCVHLAAFVHAATAAFVRVTATGIARAVTTATKCAGFAIACSRAAATMRAVAAQC